MTTYETIIGLEVHTELLTESKIFCSCSTRFGQQPNTQCCPVCLGLPGALPVLNRQVAQLALRLCLSTGCDITPVTRFDRINYFYPDLPKAYQISQLHEPIGRNGRLRLTAYPDRVVRIHEIHMEEDAGKLTHDPWSDQTLVDYNRCGVPLLEIVSEPDLRSADEALDYLATLRKLLMFLGVSDGRMEQGSLRADVNVSVRKTGTDVLGTRTEMKNMNSFKAIGRAIAHEAQRQIDLLNEGGTILQETRRWDENKEMSVAMRSKENAQDYRYFPDPDLPSVKLDSEWIERVRENLPERPEQKVSRYQQEWQLSAYEAEQLTDEPFLADLLEKTIICGAKPADVSSWILGEWLQACRSGNCDASDLNVQPEALAKLLEMVRQKLITRTTARDVFTQMIDRQVDPQTYVREHGLAMVNDLDDLKQMVASVLAESERSVKDYLAGKEKAKTYLIGQVMRKSRGKANPAHVNKLVEQQLEQYRQL